MDKLNEFKFSSMRQFGSEQFSYTANIKSDKLVLTEEEINNQINQIGMTFHKAFVGVQEREISEKALLAAASERRNAEVKKLDDALKLEMKTKVEAQQTMRQAEKLSNKLGKK